MITTDRVRTIRTVSSYTTKVGNTCRPVRKRTHTEFFQDHTARLPTTHTRVSVTNLQIPKLLIVVSIQDKVL